MTNSRRKETKAQKNARLATKYIDAVLEEYWDGNVSSLDYFKQMKLIEASNILRKVRHGEAV